MNRIAPLLALLLLPLYACSKDGGPPGGSPGVATRGATEISDAGGSEQPNPIFEERWEAFHESDHERGDTLVIGIIGDVDSLNDLTHTTRGASDVIGLLFMPLTRTNPDFSHGTGGALATGWEFSDNHRQLTMRLREDVYWTDGVKTTAHDVKFTFERQKDPVIAWSAISWKRFIERCDVVDEHTVRFTFSKLYPYQLMDAVVGYILPKHILEKVPPEEWKSCDFNRNPVGNGPYVLKEWKAQQHLVLEANPKYYRGAPPLERIIFKVVPDQQNLVLQLKTGDIDFMESVPPRYLKELEGIDHLVPYVYPSRAYGYIGWNLKNPLFQSKKVRHALTMAIDRQEIVDAVYYGYADVCEGPISPILWAYHPELPRFSYDPDRARRLLAEEGWSDHDGDGWIDKDGKRFEFELKTNKGNQIREDITVMVQDYLKQVGVKVSPNPLEWTIFSDDLNKKNFEAAVAGWSVGLKVDLRIMWHTESIDDKFNFISYSNPEVDAINDRAVDEMDRSKAIHDWHRAQEIIVGDQPYTFLYVPKQINFLHKRFRNVQMETVGWGYNVIQWWVPSAEQKYR
ncbi:MAG: peptide-binding protein [Planctomycetota bacterium]